jgi:hypothetical protein
LALFSRFVRKLAQKHAPARAWLLAEAARHPDDVDLRRAAEVFQPGATTVVSVEKIFDDFISSGDRGAFNELRFSKSSAVCRIVSAFLTQRPPAETVNRVLELLIGFESRQRANVCRCALDHWDVLAGIDAPKAVEIVSKYSIYQEALRSRAIGVLDGLLGSRFDAVARAGLDRLLK